MVKPFGSRSGRKRSGKRNPRNTSKQNDLMVVSSSSGFSFTRNLLPKVFLVSAFASGQITNVGLAYTGTFFGFWTTKCGAGLVIPNSTFGNQTLMSLISGNVSGIWNIVNLLRVKVKVVIINKEAFNTYANILVLPSASLSQFSAANIGTDLRDVPGVKTLQLQKSGSTGDTKTISFIVDIAKLEGIGRQTLLDGDYSGNYSTAPTALSGLYVQLYAADGSAALTLSNGMIWNISYEFVFHGRSQGLLTTK